jgi:hypothetical protein
MTLGDFKTRVKNGIRRNDTADSLIEPAAAAATRWLERNYTFLYMMQFRRFTISASANDPRQLSLPSSRVKAVRMLRIEKDSGYFHYVPLIDPKDMTRVHEGLPEGYWLDGRQRIWIDATPTEDLSAEIQFSEYSIFPTQDSETSWLIDNAEDVLQAQTIMFLAPELRDQKVFQFYQRLRDEGLKTLLLAEDEGKYQNMEAQMRYTNHGLG